MFTQRPCLVAKAAQSLREIGGEAVQGVNNLWLNQLHHFNEVGKISMIAQRKSRVALITEPAVWIHSPSGQNGSPRLPEIAEHCGIQHVRWTKQNLPSRGTRFV